MGRCFGAKISQGNGRKIISLKEDEEVKDASVTGLEQL